MVGTNDALHPRGGRAPTGARSQVMVAIDNLVKGAGGQAVQAMNLALGLDETRGPAAAGIFPC